MAARAWPLPNGRGSRGYTNDTHCLHVLPDDLREDWTVELTGWTVREGDMPTHFTLRRQLTKGSSVRTFVIAAGVRAGWELQDWFGDKIVRRLDLTDWHRVERATLALEREVRSLTAQGWTESYSNSVEAVAGSTNR